MAGGSWRKRGKIHYVRDSGTWLPATVPGTVHTDLLANGKIEDPFYRTNEDATRELFWKDYEFCRTFAVTEDVLNEKKVILVCEGLDTLADIYINGKKAGSTDNMHRTWKLDAN